MGKKEAINLFTNHNIKEIYFLIKHYKLSKLYWIVCFNEMIIHKWSVSYLSINILKEFYNNDI